MKYFLAKDGFEKHKIGSSNRILLNKFKKDVMKALNLEINKNIKLEKIHEFISQDINFNELKLNLMKKINNSPKNNKIIFDILKESLVNLLGPDIAGQKNINLVIQKPYDTNYVNLHKDSPPNSPHEIVIWLPLVDCKKTMAFRFLNIHHSKKIKMMFKKGIPERKILAFANKNSISLDVKYGEFIIFWTGIYHYAVKNVEKNTRWSINLRYKNLFSPYGMKGFMDFFEAKNYSKLSKLTIDNI